MLPDQVWSLARMYRVLGAFNALEEENHLDNKINDYHLICAADAVTVSYSVVVAIENGWQPLGRPFYTPEEGIIQCMVKYTTKDTDTSQ